MLDCPFACTIDHAIEMMEGWLAIRDHKTFFVTITDARDEAAAMFDRCKNINQFVNEQFENYQSIKQFLSVNHDNFTFLTEAQQQTVEKLKAIVTDKEPWESLPSYMKMKRNLNGQLQECKAALVAQIQENYRKVFDELDEYATSVHVSPDKYTNRDSVIARLTTSNNFFALSTNADTTRFYEEETAKINCAIVTPTPPASTDKPTVVAEPAPRIRKVVHLHTHHATPIRTEQDIDCYLQQLKEQLMQHISEDKEIIIN